MTPRPEASPEVPADVPAAANRVPRPASDAAAGGGRAGVPGRPGDPLPPDAPQPPPGRPPAPDEPPVPEPTPEPDEPSPDLPPPPTEPPGPDLPPQPEVPPSPAPPPRPQEPPAPPPDLGPDRGGDAGCGDRSPTASATTSFPAASAGPEGAGAAAPSSDRLRHAIDAGAAADKKGAADPAAAPLGTDDEAAGTPPDAAQRAVAWSQEVEGRPGQSPAEGGGHPVSSDRPGLRGSRLPLSWMAVTGVIVILFLLAALVV